MDYIRFISLIDITLNMEEPDTLKNAGILSTPGLNLKGLHFSSICKMVNEASVMMLFSRYLGIFLECVQMYVYNNELRRIRGSTMFRSGIIIMN